MIKFIDTKAYKIINELYLPECGEGETMATQTVTAVNKLVYKWYNDGDVYDNTAGLDGWCNDLSSYANWLYNHLIQSREILDRIYMTFSERDYEALLDDLTETLFNADDLAAMHKIEKTGSIYTEDGKFEIYFYEEDEDEDW